MPESSNSLIAMQHNCSIEAQGLAIGNAVFGQGNVSSISGNALSAGNYQIGYDPSYAGTFRCNHCGAIYYSYENHSCQGISQYQQPPQLPDYYKQAYDYLSGLDTSFLKLKKETKMTKDTLVIINDGGNVVVETDKGLEAAKEAARGYTNKSKSRCFILKAVWSCAPKNDLEEGDV